MAERIFLPESELMERPVQNASSHFQFTVIQGKIRGRARIVKLKGSAALIVADRVLATGKHLMLVRATAGDGHHTNRLVQLHATVERGDDEKCGYVLRLLHAQCPAGLDVLLTFLQEELGLVTQNPAVADAVGGPSGPVTFRFDTRNFEMGGARLQEEPEEPVPVYRATPIARRVPMVQEVTELAHRQPAGRRPEGDAMPDLEGDPDEFVSMFGMKVRRGQFDKLGDLTYKPGGAGNAVRSAKRDDEDAGAGRSEKKRKTGFIKRVARALVDNPGK